MRIIAIDPGKTGAIATYRKETIFDKGEIKVYDMPKIPKEITDFLYSKPETIVYIEHIQPRETDKTHVSSAMKLMKNYGICLGALYAYDMHVKIVKSSVWMSGMIKPGLDYSKRKTELWKLSKTFFPDMKVKKSQADALCLLQYGLGQEGCLLEYPNRL